MSLFVYIWMIYSSWYKFSTSSRDKDFLSGSFQMKNIWDANVILGFRLLEMDINWVELNIFWECSNVLLCLKQVQYLLLWIQVWSLVLVSRPNFIIGIFKGLWFLKVYYDTYKTWHSVTVAMLISRFTSNSSPHH